FGQEGQARIEVVAHLVHERLERPWVESPRAGERLLDDGVRRRLVSPGGEPSHLDPERAGGGGDRAREPDLHVEERADPPVAAAAQEVATLLVRGGHGRLEANEPGTGWGQLGTPAFG